MIGILLVAVLFLAVIDVVGFIMIDDLRHDIDNMPIARRYDDRSIISRLECLEKTFHYTIKEMADYERYTMQDHESGSVEGCNDTE